MKWFVFGLMAFAVLSGDTTDVTLNNPVYGNVIPFWGSSYPAVRFQSIYYQNQINRGGRIIKFAFMPTSTISGTYNNFRFYLCHTNQTELSSTFNTNYSGNTPVLVIDSATFTVNGVAQQWLEWPISFDYNNTANLLIEVCWRGSNSTNVPVWVEWLTGSKRVFNLGDDTAPSGSVDYVVYYAKLSIETQTGVEEVVIGDRPEMPAITISPSLVRSNGHVRFSANSVPGDVREVKVYATTGELIRTIWLDGTRSGVWNLRDQNNLGVPAGVYLLKSGSACGRVTVTQ